MRDAISGEAGLSIDGSTREETMAPEAAVTKFTIEIHHDTIALLERIVKEMVDVTSFSFMILAETFHSLHSLLLEDYATLLEFSTGILLVNCIFCNALSPFAEAYLSMSTGTDFELPLPSTILFKLKSILNNTVADLGSIGNIHLEVNITSAMRVERFADSGDITSSFYFLTDYVSGRTNLLSYISPEVTMIVGPLTVMILTFIIADNKYYLFATLFAPTVDRVLSSIRSFLAYITPNNGEYQHRTIPEDEETYDGVLWGMVALFCLESILVGSIVVLVVLISLSLTILASMSTMLSPREISEISEEMTKLLVGFLVSWVMCVLTTNVLRMVLYQTVDRDD
jgi:hypothetical protein